MSEESGTTVSFYEAVGGEETFTRLVHRFYQEVAADPVLRPVYPTQDLGPAEEHLRLFLIQYWGGPPTYNELRGHPRLRMRHVRFRIGETERDLWLKHMRTALDELSLPAELDAPALGLPGNGRPLAGQRGPRGHARRGRPRRARHHTRLTCARLCPVRGWRNRDTAWRPAV